MALKAKLVGREKVHRTLNLVQPNIAASLAGMQMKVAVELAEKIKSYAPVGDDDRKRGRPPGTYRNSIHADRLADRPDAQFKGKFQRSKDPNATGVFAEWLWRFLEFGTRPHTIKAKNAARLVFRGSDGQLRYAREVNHPGAPAQPHIFPVYRSERKNMRRRMARVVNRALKKAANNQRATPADGKVA